MMKFGEKRALLKPLPVAPNAAIGVIAPASPAKSERVDLGLAALRSLGYAPRLALNARLREPLYFAGTARERLADLHAAFVDPSTAAIMCIRGGYGSNYLLQGLALESVAAHPKTFFAYSDLTGIQLRLLDEIGLPVFHGPMLAADFYLSNGVHLESFRAALAGELYSVGEAEGMRTLKPSASSKPVRGMLYGGCLSIIASLLDTPWEPNTEGTLLFLEDTGVKPYQIDRMLWQLRHAGKFEGVRGIVFGEMLDCSSPGAPSSLLDEAILNALDGLDVPIAIGLRSGHVSRENVTLTFGVEAELTVGEAARLDLLEPAVKK
ncbi:MAG TPA: LD-carboxypeptidase [Terracidiphilus sp.]|jgi:muramoyltetrapeptide carboxypeptidase